MYVPTLYCIRCRCPRRDERSLLEHFDGPQCVVDRTLAEMKGEGFAPLAGRCWSMARDLGIELRVAPIKAVSTWMMKKGVAKRFEKALDAPRSERFKIVEGVYAPSWVATVLQYMGISSSLRKAAVRFGMRSEDKRLALESIWRLMRSHRRDDEPLAASLKTLLEES